MIHKIYSHTALPPPNLLDMGPRDTGYIPIHRSEALTVLYLFVCLLFSVGLELYHL